MTATPLADGRVLVVGGVSERTSELYDPASGMPGTDVSDAALAEGGVVHHHPGISGGADLAPAVHGWTDPVAEITVEQVE